MRSLVVVLAVTLGACGDDGYDPKGCLPEGTADVAGMVKNEGLGPFVRAQITPTRATKGPQYAIVLDEVAGECGDVGQTGKHLVLLFCEMPLNLPYTIASQQTFGCPTNDILAILEAGGGEDLAVATSGTVELMHAGTCMDGMYELDFGIDRLSGNFDAAVCE